MCDGAVSQTCGIRRSREGPAQAPVTARSPSSGAGGRRYGSVDAQFPDGDFTAGGPTAAVVTLPNVVHAAFSLMVTLFSIAGLYVFLQADFLAATQVIVYVGGILVLILFGVLMTSSKLVMKVNIEVSKWQMFGGIIVSSALFAVLLLLIFETPWNILSEVVDSSDSTTEQIGIAILQKKFLLPFEVTSIVLLIALIGAVFISRTEVQE